MMIRTAMVASTKVRRTGVIVRSQSPRIRLRASYVGNTARQIIRASRCLDGGPNMTGHRIGRQALWGWLGGHADQAGGDLTEVQGELLGTAFSV